MIVAKLTISYDRGTSLNRGTEIGAALKKGDVTADGGVVRGLGSHFRSQADMEAAQARDKERNRIYQSFRERFITTTIDGLYLVSGYGLAKEFVESLRPVGIEVRVSEFELTSSAGLDVEELAAWGGKIKRQLGAVALGRKKQVEESGVKAINALADCPLLTDETRTAIKNLVALLSTEQIDRTEFRKRLDEMNVAIKQIDKAHDARVAEMGKQAAFIDAAV